jgi:hypothetical protein
VIKLLILKKIQVPLYEVREYRILGAQQATIAVYTQQPDQSMPRNYHGLSEERQTTAAHVRTTEIPAQGCTAVIHGDLQAPEERHQAH